MKTQPTAIVSGSHGFIGQNLVNRLTKAGITVYPMKWDKIASSEALYLPRGVDYIFHLAAFGNHGFQNDPVSIINENIGKTFAFMYGTKGIDYKAFINVSTSSVYGHKTDAMSEYDRIDPNSFYSASKATTEALANAFVEEYGLPIINVRPFSVYGPGEKDHRLIPTVIKKIMTGEELSFTPTPSHDWIYVDDFIDALFVLLKNPDKLKGQVFNIGTSTGFDNQVVLDQIESIMQLKARVKHDYEEPQAHSPVWVADITKMRALGWEPKTNLTEGLKKTVKYYVQRYAGN